jgi:hypothetical protein
MAERRASGLPAPHQAADALIAGAYLAGNQHAAGSTRACGGVRRVGRQGCGQPRPAQGEGRLGCLERAFPRRRADRSARARRDGRARSARQKGDLRLVARRAGRAGGRPESAARESGPWREKRGGLAHAARRSRQARIADAGAGHRRRRAGLKRRWRRCGPTRLSNAARCTSIAISSPVRPSRCIRKSRTTKKL